MKSTQPARPRRCTLAVPGSSEQMMAKATTLSVAHVLLDLEDAVAVEAQESGNVHFVHLLLEQLAGKLVLSRRIGIECLSEEVEGLMVDAASSRSSQSLLDQANLLGL